jgi:hypothetical protein
MGAKKNPQVGLPETYIPEMAWDNEMKPRIVIQYIV